MRIKQLQQNSTVVWLVHGTIDLVYQYSMSGHRVVQKADTHFYSATKFAVTALTEGVRQELREMESNCRVTVCIAFQTCFMMIIDSLFLLD